MSDDVLPSPVEAARLEAEYRHALVKCRVPRHLHDGLVRYLVHGYRPGSFLQAVLENDLTQAILRGDDESIGESGLRRLMAFLYSHAPAGRVGSPTAVAEWLRVSALERTLQVQFAADRETP